MQRYGHEISLVETFVEQNRFRGTCYQAANWQRIGETVGRSRQDRYSKMKVPIKDIYIYPLLKTTRNCFVYDKTGGKQFVLHKSSIPAPGTIFTA